MTRWSLASEREWFRLMDACSSFLIASSDALASETLGAILFDAGFVGRRVTGSDDALSELERGAYDVVIVDQEVEAGPVGAASITSSKSTGSSAPRKGSASSRAP